MTQYSGRSSQQYFDPSSEPHAHCPPTRFLRQRSCCIVFKLEKRDTRPAVFECDSELGSLTPLTELTLWKVWTGHTCVELAT